jgi:hypothetical protein
VAVECGDVVAYDHFFEEGLRLDGAGLGDFCGGALRISEWGVGGVNDWEQATGTPTFTRFA